VNPNGFKNIQVNVSGLGCWLVLFGIIWLCGIVGLGWLVKSIFALILLIALAPVVIFLGFRWWLQRNLVQDQCPVCGYQLTGMKGMQIQCPSCGEVLKTESGTFQQVSAVGSIEVDAVEVQTNVDVEVVDAEVIDIQARQIEGS